MDKRSVHQPCRRNKQTKAKKKPIKVVYISNPMRVTTSASDFRALVQELTGQDSDPAEVARFSHTQASREITRVPPGPDTREPDSPNLSGSIASDGVATDPTIFPFDFFGDIFSQHMVEGYATAGQSAPPFHYEPLVTSVEPR